MNDNGIAELPTDMCVCGHIRDTHEHYREGNDCGACGADVCPHFRLKRAT